MLQQFKNISKHANKSDLRQRMSKKRRHSENLHCHVKHKLSTTSRNSTVLSCVQRTQGTHPVFAASVCYTFKNSKSSLSCRNIFFRDVFKRGMSSSKAVYAHCLMITMILMTRVGYLNKSVKSIPNL